MSRSTGNRFTAMAYVGRQPASSEPTIAWEITCGHTHRDLELAKRCARRLKREWPRSTITIGARWVP